MNDRDNGMRNFLLFTLIVIGVFSFIAFKGWKYFGGGELAQVVGPVLGQNQVFIKEENGIARTEDIALVPLAFGPGEIPASAINSRGEVLSFRIGSLPTQLKVTAYRKDGSAAQGVAFVKTTIGANQVQTHFISFNNTSAPPAFVVHPAVDTAFNTGQIKAVVRDLATPSNPNDGIYEGVLPSLSQMTLVRDGPVMRI